MAATPRARCTARIRGFKPGNRGLSRGGGLDVDPRVGLCGRWVVGFRAQWPAPS